MHAHELFDVLEGDAGCVAFAAGRSDHAFVALIGLGRQGNGRSLQSDGGNVSADHDA